MLDISRLIQVQVGLTQPGAVGRNFNELLIMGDSNVINGLQRERQYQSLAGVAADFGVTAPEYLAAEVYYAQSPQPTYLAIGRWLSTATAAQLQGALLTSSQQALGNFTAITSGGFDVTIDGSAKTITGLSFSAAANLNAVAADITSGLSGAGTVTWNGSQFILTSATTGAGTAASGTITFTGNPTAADTVTINGVSIEFVSSSPTGNEVLIGTDDTATATNLNTFLVNSTNASLLTQSYSVSGLVVTVTSKTVGTGGNSIALAKSSSSITLSASDLAGGVNASSVSYMTSPASGQDISSLLGMTAALGLPLVPGYAAETPLQAVVALDALDPNWYGLMFAASTMPVQSDYLSIAAFIQADQITRLFGVTIQDTNVLSSSVTTDLASEMLALDYTQSFVAYCSTNAYSVASAFGRLFTVNLAGSNTAIDLCYKQMPGIASENLTVQQANTLQAKQCNVFAAYDNNTSIFQYGKTCGAAFIDETYFDNALQNAIQTNVYNVLYTSTTKVLQTDQGEQQFANAITQACQQFVTNGYGAPGVWNAAGFGSLQQGQTLKLGYYVYAPSVASQSEGARAARESVPFQVAFKEAGSNQTVLISVEVNQ